MYDKAGIGDRPQGHFVGMATHDVTRPTGPIKVGQVLTVEPYIDLPEKQIHVRVEDTVVITENGAEILSSGVPKEMADIEKLVGSEVSRATEDRVNRTKENRRAGRWLALCSCGCDARVSSL